MITKLFAPDQDISCVIKVVEERTITFFRDELGMVANRTRHHAWQQQFVVLRSITAMVAVGSRPGIYIAYSYSSPIIKIITKIFTSGLTIGPNEQDLYEQEAASEIVNIIVGNCTADLARQGELITLSSPMILIGARTIHGRQGTTVASLNLEFANGEFDIAFVGPKIRFDGQLNYQEIIP